MPKASVRDLIAKNPPQGRAWRSGLGFIENTPELAEILKRDLYRGKKDPLFTPTYAVKILRLWAKENKKDYADRITLGTVKLWWDRQP